ncbi:hypothetical protein BLNAU_9186 [Blattamonas nauphoetae]|uniref:Uncharacterized protein n=1 Tax=Blattamonas nauphoetae TaxID=2049346 RepID=A0ABQ9XWK3_9EUKA|nr:hypothetical protein BLNAU_9186 [Blattamonas nauphoetae]
MSHLQKTTYQSYIEERNRLGDSQLVIPPRSLAQSWPLPPLQQPPFAPAKQNLHNFLRQYDHLKLHVKSIQTARVNIRSEISSFISETNDTLLRIRTTFSSLMYDSSLRQGEDIADDEYGELIRIVNQENVQSAITDVEVGIGELQKMQNSFNPDPAQIPNQLPFFSDKTLFQVTLDRFFMMVEDSAEQTRVFARNTNKLKSTIVISLFPLTTFHKLITDTLKVLPHMDSERKKREKDLQTLRHNHLFRPESVPSDIQDIMSRRRLFDVKFGVTTTIISPFTHPLAIIAPSFTIHPALSIISDTHSLNHSFAQPDYPTLESTHMPSPVPSLAVSASPLSPSPRMTADSSLLDLPSFETLPNNEPREDKSQGSFGLIRRTSYDRFDRPEDQRQIPIEIIPSIVSPPSAYSHSDFQTPPIVTSYQSQHPYGFTPGTSPSSFSRNQLGLSGQAPPLSFSASSPTRPSLRRGSLSQTPTHSPQSFSNPTSVFTHHIAPGTFSQPDPVEQKAQHSHRNTPSLPPLPPSNTALSPTVPIAHGEETTAGEGTPRSHLSVFASPGQVHIPGSFSRSATLRVSAPSSISDMIQQASAIPVLDRGSLSSSQRSRTGSESGRKTPLSGHGSMQSFSHAGSSHSRMTPQSKHIENRQTAAGIPEPIAIGQPYQTIMPMPLSPHTPTRDELRSLPPESYLPPFASSLNSRRKTFSSVDGSSTAISPSNPSPKTNVHTFSSSADLNPADRGRSQTLPMGAKKEAFSPG